MTPFLRHILESHLLAISSPDMRQYGVWRNVPSEIAGESKTSVGVKLEEPHRPCGVSCGPRRQYKLNGLLIDQLTFDANLPFYVPPAHYTSTKIVYTSTRLNDVSGGHLRIRGISSASLSMNPAVVGPFHNRQSKQRLLG